MKKMIQRMIGMVAVLSVVLSMTAIAYGAEWSNDTMIDDTVMPAWENDYHNSNRN